MSSIKDLDIQNNVELLKLSFRLQNPKTKENFELIKTFEEIDNILNKKESQLPRA